MDETRLVINVTIIFSEAVQLMRTVGAQFANNVSSVRGRGVEAFKKPQPITLMVEKY